MSAQTLFRLIWSSSRRGYELFEPGSSEPLTLLTERLDEPAWLEEINSFAFVGQKGAFTARKETRSRGEGYWYAYRKQSGKLAKKYLGRGTELSLSHLEQVAGLLGQAPESTGQAVGSAEFFPPVKDEILLLNPTPPPSAPTHPFPPPKQEFPSDPLLATKLRQPRPRHQLVRRNVLIERLNQATASTLTLVSAPAGFGKTTLLADWLASTNIPVAWLSLDAQDDEPLRFFTYFIAALQTLHPSVGKAALTLLHGSSPSQFQTVIVLLANDLLTNFTGDFVLVLDDYHFINAKEIQQTLGFLLEHVPPQMRLIIVTRADPPLPLARLRARGQLNEIRVNDLRFAGSEAETFLHNTMKLELSPEQIEILQNRTEGWIAGLQFAALSLRGRSDTSEFLQAFSGSHRFVLDYLSGEVFFRQPLAVQNFLLFTSILERLSSSLCNALTGQEDGQDSLESLERGNMFVIPLDDERHWYRYHHLFADMLQSRLKQVNPALVGQLHERASRWCEEHNLVIEAIRHAFAIPDVERVAQLIEQTEKSQNVLTQAQLLSWLDALPQTLVRSRPLLCVIHARLLQIHRANPKVIEAWLNDAEQALENYSEDKAFVVSRVAYYRAVLALYVGNIARCVTLARQLLATLPAESNNWYLQTLILTARDFLLSGDVTTKTEQPLNEMVELTRTANLPAKFSVFYLLARFQTMQGRLGSAATTYQSLVEQIGQNELRALVGGAAYFFGMGNIYREWNDLAKAEELLVGGLEIVRNNWGISADILTLGYIALADLYRARNAYQQAHSLLDEFLQLARQREFVPLLLDWVKAAQIRLALAQGQLVEAIAWAETNRLPEVYEPDYQREQEYLTLVRVRIAQGREHSSGTFLDQALTSLDRLQQEAESKRRWQSVLEILILRSLALDAKQANLEVLNTLEQALKLAEPAGYVRLFLDEGKPMLKLLSRLQSRRTQPSAYLAKLLEVGNFQEPTASPPSSVSGQTLYLPNFQALPEPLSERELEILRLIAQGVSNATIAEQLVIEVSTVKRHVSNILGKLSVANRTQAVAHARLLGLL
jgi:LuxR family transcriptional regulator, maltose regulon positive regulatory protein